MRQATAAPTRKVVAATGGAGVGNAIAEIAVYLLEQWRDLPPNIEFAVTTLVVAACALAAGYLVPPSKDDAPVEG